MMLETTFSTLSLFCPLKSLLYVEANGPLEFFCRPYEFQKTQKINLQTTLGA